jgi:3-oxoacyl-[acyl-carrier protein] reductase
VALVTGSSRGIGAAIAGRLAADGARVVLHGRSERARVEAVAAAIRARGGAAEVVLGDLETAEAPVRIVREAFAFEGRLDILVCNAARGGGGLTVDLGTELVDGCLAVNLRAVILATSEFARLTRSPHGRVVVISSGAATHPAYGSSVYAASKAGAEAFARSAAQELGARGITVNSVAPGTTETDMSAGMSWLDKIPPWTALRRIGRPEEVADVVAFLASDEARWVTGATVPANGGLVTCASNVINYA